MADDQQIHDDATPELPPAEPIHSRFLFVDVSARRAIQLKRGARVRLRQGEHERTPHKLERTAMEEVKQGLIHYALPDTPSTV
jgi:DNA-directed RNA polymerase omega subunit